MKLFLLGDFESNNGPGNANKQIRDSLAKEYEVEFSSASNKFSRILEMYIGVGKADILLICSKSEINYAAIKIARNFKRKIIYLMHGYASYEAIIANPSISEEQLDVIKGYETFVYDASHRIVCVSKHCMEFMKNQFPQYEDKLDYVYNIVDVNKIKNICFEKDFLRQKNKILSVGGGMRRKNNLVVARAISRQFDNLEYVIVGNVLEDGIKIKEFGFVSWVEHLSHKELLQLMRETSIYIQNSMFETFGLAIIEALYAGCSLLISNDVGCLDLFETIMDTDIIYDTTDEKEISKKIEHLLQEPNNTRLIKGFREELISKEYQRNRWNEIIQQIPK